MAPPVAKVSVQEFADLIGVTSQRIYQLVKSGLPTRKESGLTKIVPSEGVKWYIEHQTWEHQQQRKKQKGGVDEKDERALKARADRLMAELDLLERSKTVVLATELTEFIERVFGGFAAVTLGRLQRFEKEILRAKTPAEARKLTVKLQAALMDGARAYADQLDDEAAELEKVAAEEEHTRRKSVAIQDDDDDDEEEAE
jgi:hypothetical protein